MANTHSNIKRIRSNKVKLAKNAIVRTTAKTALKNGREAIKSGDASAAVEQVKKAIQALDAAAEKKVLHKNNVARRKSRLQLQLNALATKKSK